MNDVSENASSRFRSSRFGSRYRRRHQYMQEAVERVWIESLDRRLLLSAGQLDTNYGNGGIALSGAFTQTASTIQPDGKMVVAGEFTNASGKVIVGLTRFNLNGSVDTSFGNNGLVTQDVVGTAIAEHVHCVVLQFGGEIIVGGDVYAPKAGGGTDVRSMIAGFTSSGAFDTSFSYGGSNSSVDIYPSSSEGANEYITAMTVNIFNQIIAVGRAWDRDLSGSPLGVAIRYTSNGTEDTSYGVSGGYTLLNNSVNSLEEAGAVAFDPYGRTVIADGNTIAALDDTGKLDSTVGNDGIETLSSGGVDHESGMAIYTDASAGNVILLTGPGLSAVRLTDAADGIALDPSFGTDGVATIPYTLFRNSVNIGSFTSVAVQSDGKIVLGGYTSELAGEFSQDHDFAIARLNSDGFLDSSFANGGALDMSDGSESSVVSTDGDGMINVVGGSQATIEILRLQPGEYPFPGTAFQPGNTIQAEDFDNGGQAVAYNILPSAFAPSGLYRGTNVYIFSDDTRYSVSNFHDGCYLQYTVDVPAGVYRLQVSYASTDSDSTFKVSFDSGAVTTPTLSPADTGSFSTYATFTSPNITLTSGDHIMRITAPANPIDFDSYTLVPAPGSPTAKLTSAPTLTAQAANYQFTVTYNDSVPINVSTLENSNITVTGPNGYSQTAMLVSESSADVTKVTVTYQVTDGTSWNYLDNGSYNIALNANQVSDENGTFLGEGHLGSTPSFKVTIPIPYGSISGTVVASTATGTTPLAGALVYLDQSNSGTYAASDPSVRTGANGTFSFTKLMPGATYHVRQNPPLAFVGASPSSGAINVALINGQVSTGNTFLDSLNLTISQVVPSIDFPSTPINGQLGSIITIYGTGLIPGTLIKFGAESDWTTPASYPTLGQEITVTLPALAMNGVVTVFNPTYGGTASKAGVEGIDNYRDVDGFNFRNFDVPTGYNWGDIDNLMGFDLLNGIFDDIATAIFHDGQCSGMSFAAQRIIDGGLFSGQFAPANPQDVSGFYRPYELASPLDNQGNYIHGNNLAYFIHLQQLNILSAEFLGHALDEMNADWRGGAQRVYGEIMSDFKAGVDPMISMIDTHADGFAHSIVAYNVTLDPSDPGGYYIWCWDNNAPYDPNAESTGSTHELNTLNSRVHVSSSGQWTFYGSTESGDAPGVVQDSSNSSQDWHGSFNSASNLIVTDMQTIPLHPTMPLSIQGIFHLGFSVLSNIGLLFNLAFSSGGATTTQITDSSGHTLYGADGLPNDGTTRIPDSFVYYPPHATFVDNQPELPLNLLVGNGSYTQTITGTGAGNYQDIFTGQDYLGGIEQVPGTKGITDSIGFDPTGFDFTTGAASKPITAMFITQPSGAAELQASLSTTSFKGGSDTFSLDKSLDNLVYQHQGAATSFTVTLNALDAQGIEESFSSGVLAVAPGDTVTVSPSSWSTLSTATAMVTVNHSNGTKTVTVVKNHAPAVSLAGVEGKPLSGVFAGFSPGGTLPASDYSVLINWGDGNSGTGAIKSNSAGGYSISGTHTYSEAGYYGVTCSVTNIANTAVTTVSAGVAISEAALSIIPVAVKATTGAPYTGVVATLADGNTLETAKGFTATITWGDGSTSPGAITQTSAGHFAVSGSHTFTRAGSFASSVVVIDGATDQITTATIDASKSKNFKGRLATLPLFLPNVILADYAGTINWGDGLSSAATLSIVGGDAIALSGSHTYSKASKYTATLELKGGLRAKGKSTATVGAGATIGGSVFNDANANGKKDAGEKPLAKYTVYLDLKHDRTLDPGDPSTVTASDGTFKFSNIPAGTYWVTEIVPKGWRIDSPEAGYSVITVGAGKTFAENVFADTQFALVSGSLFNDKNGNGQQNSGETSLVGWKLFVDFSGDGKFENNELSAVTDKAGNWSFENVPQGTFNIYVTPPTGWRITTPKAGKITVSVGPGSIRLGNLFGATNLATPTTLTADAATESGVSTLILYL